jgi:hypothetical protein
MQLVMLNNISGFVGMEFSTFKLKEGVSETELFKAADEAVNGFMSKEEGFLGHSILRGEHGVYVDVLFAASKQQAVQICAKWVNNPFCSAYLEKIQEDSVNLSFFERIK